MPNLKPPLPGGNVVVGRSTSPITRIVVMIALVVAGESVFFLPFVLARVFRPTLLDVYGLTNLQLGTAFSIYGVVAMLAYFPGGPLADRFPPRKLIAIALVTTALGGLVMASIPSLPVLIVLYGFWGITTILLLWSPLIRATREWAGGELPGRAFGLLDGGRGLVAAVIGSMAVAVFAAVLPVDVDGATLDQRSDALRYVILVFTFATFATALLVWSVLPSSTEGERDSHSKSKPNLGRVIRMPTVWIQAAIVVCAYAGYKGLDDISLYANEALGFDEVNSARIGAVTLWVRPVAAIGAGVIADRVGVTTMTMFSFANLAIASGVIAAGWLRPGMVIAFFATLLATSAALFALRGLYFAIMEEGRVPFASTGTAVGIVSVIGYTPDVFMGPLMGALLDRSPGAAGHHHVFAVVSAFAVTGLVATILFRGITRDSIDA